NYDIIMAELKAFSEELATKPVVVAANKMDLPDSRELFPMFKEELEKRGIKVFSVSGATREGVEDLLKFLSGMLKEFKATEQIQANQEEALYQYLAPFVIESAGDGYYQVSGAEIERLVAMTDFTSDDAIAMFKRKLKKMGFIDELAGMDAEPNDVFSIGEMEFEYREFFD
ncbi:MAG: Obg family GTPase CgtA, partial [Candidatus Rifleibacteriota bacterium]